MAYAEDFLLKRLDYGQGKGLFMTNISLFADNKLTLKRLENTATALFSGEAGNKTPLIVNEDLKEIYLDNVRKLQIPKVRFDRAMSEKRLLYVLPYHNMLRLKRRKYWILGYLDVCK